MLPVRLADFLLASKVYTGNYTLKLDSIALRSNSGDLFYETISYSTLWFSS